MAACIAAFVCNEMFSSPLCVGINISMPCHLCDQMRQTRHGVVIFIILLNNTCPIDSFITKPFMIDK